eukprot:224373-Lingulodinium_polyedra.AAC.1
MREDWAIAARVGPSLPGSARGVAFSMRVASVCAGSKRWRRCRSSARSRQSSMRSSWSCLISAPISAALP